MKLNNSVNNRRCFVLSVDDCNRLTMFVNVLIQVNKRTRLCTQERKARKTKSTKKPKITSLLRSSSFEGQAIYMGLRGPILFGITQPEKHPYSSQIFTSNWQIAHT
jgi:hypothetical protein